MWRAFRFRLGHLLIGSYERDAIRPHVLGRSRICCWQRGVPRCSTISTTGNRRLRRALKQGPFAPNRGVVNGVPNTILPSPFARRRARTNENYGREVMELHTLGVKGGYTQDDAVIAVARCFTTAPGPLSQSRKSGVRLRAVHA